MTSEPDIPEDPRNRAEQRTADVLNQLDRSAGEGGDLPGSAQPVPDASSLVDPGAYSDPGQHNDSSTLATGRGGAAPGSASAPFNGPLDPSRSAASGGGPGAHAGLPQAPDGDGINDLEAAGSRYDRARAHEDNLHDGLDGRSRADDALAAGLADNALGGFAGDEFENLPKIFASDDGANAPEVPRAGTPSRGTGQGGVGVPGGSSNPASGPGGPSMQEMQESLEGSGGWGGKITAALAGALLVPFIGLLVIGLLVFGLPTLAAITAVDPDNGFAAVEKVSEVFIEPEQLNAAQDAAASSDVPWPVLVAVSTLATENGKFSPYADDMIDRNLDRKGIRRPNAGETGPGVAGGGAAFTADGQIPLLGTTTVSADKMAAFVRSKRKDVTINLEELAVHFVNEGAIEGVKADVAWVQSILETTWFSFVGSRVEPTDHNYAGIGAYDSTNTNFGYPSPQMGARAQMQLLKLYADPNGVNTLKNPLLTNTPVKGCCQTVMQLSGVWASSQEYGHQITRLYTEMLAFAGASPTVAPPGGVGPPAPVAAPATPAASGRTSAPAELVPYGNGRIPTQMLKPVGGTSELLWGPAADAFTRLLADASGQGISIGINDSYRDYDSQVRVAREKGLYSQGGLAAEPGTSNHGWGVAVDLSFGVGALAWMRANAGRYGFFETVPREDWHWEYQGGGSSGNVPAGGGGGVAYPANPEGLEVASYPQVTPAIGKDSDPGVGPYLLVPRVASGGGVDPQRTGLGDDSAHTFVAEQLGIIRDEMYDEGWAVPGSDESADAFWTEAVNRLPVADPRSGRSCQAPTITGTASDQVAYRDQVAVAIGELWRCELDRAPRLDVMTSLDTQAGSAQVSQLVIDEAMSVAWAFSRWGTSACDATAEYAGVFPLTEEQFLANAAPEQLSAGRCSPAANIQAAAAAFVRLEQVAAEDRVEAGGPYSRMLGGWAAMPPALGSAEALAAFNSSGPGGGGGASVECRAALDTAVAVAERNEADAAAILSTVRADTVVSSTCAGVDQQVVDNALVESLLARVGVLKSVDELTEGGVGDPASGDADYAEQLARLDRDAAPVVVGRAELDARAGRLQSVADVLAASGVAMFTVGVDSAVPRLSSTGRSAADEPGHPVRTDPTSDDWAGTVVKLAGQLGGTWTGDERAQKKQSADDAMATIRQFWNVAGGTGPTGLYATGGIVGGNGSVSPDQCPTMAAPNTLRQGAEAVGLATICRNSVLQAPTPQAAAAIINALGPSMLGKPYSQPSRMQPTHFDCSSYVSRAYRAAGLMTGSWSPTTYTYLSGYPWTRRISPAETRPGDLVLNQPGHIVMALADGWMVHTNRTGDISHVKRLYDLNSVHAVVRIIPEAAPPTPAGTPL